MSSSRRKGPVKFCQKFLKLRLPIVTISCLCGSSVVSGRKLSSIGSVINFCLPFLLRITGHHLYFVFFHDTSLIQHLYRLI